MRPAFAPSAKRKCAARAAAGRFTPFGRWPAAARPARLAGRSHVAPLPTPNSAADDPRCVPIKLTAPIPTGDEIACPDYTAKEHDVWRTLCARPEELLPGRAADEFLTASPRSISNAKKFRRCAT